MPFLSPEGHLSRNRFKMEHNPQESTNPVFLGIGSNIGDRIVHLQEALGLLQDRGFILEKASQIYETPPWGLREQPAFLNQVLQGTFQGTPYELLKLNMQIEEDCGRVRLEHWGPRVIDIDILAMGQYMIHSQRLSIPHPHFQNRAFVLVPWAEIAPGFVPPGTGESIRELIGKLPSREIEEIKIV